LVTSWQPGWREQVEGLSEAQGVGVPVQPVVDQPPQSSCELQVVWSVIALQGVIVPVQGTELLDQ
jgi:hypothetical protein